MNKQSHRVQCCHLRLSLEHKYKNTILPLKSSVCKNRVLKLSFVNVQKHLGILLFTNILCGIKKLERVLSMLGTWPSECAFNYTYATVSGNNASIGAAKQFKNGF